MQKMFTDLTRHALNGQTMGTRWSALFYGEKDFDPGMVHLAFQDAVSRVDQQMSTWKSDSDINRLNDARPGEWVSLPEDLIFVLQNGLQIGEASGGAFDIGMGDAVAAWGFGSGKADQESIRKARLASRSPAYDMLEIDSRNMRACKHANMMFDLNGIAKGYGVDKLAETALAHGVRAGLYAIDGELHACGSQPDGKAWTVAVEKPDLDIRSTHSILELQDASVATSGDYRHWVDIGEHRLSHTMDPRLGMPLRQSPASVTVIAKDCMSADAWATAMMVMGVEKGLELAGKLGLSVLFLYHGERMPSGCGIFSTE